MVVQYAWDEKIPDYTITYCNKCGASFTGPNQVIEAVEHNFSVDGGYYTETVYKIVHHDAVTERQWVVDVPAYDEYGVFDHYECSKCGAVTKTIGVRTFLLCSISDIKKKVGMVSENR